MIWRIDAVRFLGRPEEKACRPDRLPGPQPKGAARKSPTSPKGNGTQGINRDSAGLPDRNRTGAEKDRGGVAQGHENKFRTQAAAFGFGTVQEGGPQVVTLLSQMVGGETVVSDFMAPSLRGVSTWDMEA